MRAGLKDLLEMKKIKTDAEGYVYIENFVYAMRSVHSYAIPIQSAMEIAIRSERVLFKAISNKILIKDKSPSGASALCSHSHKLERENAPAHRSAPALA